MVDRKKSAKILRAWLAQLASKREREHIHITFITVRTYTALLLTLACVIYRVIVIPVMYCGGCFYLRFWLPDVGRQGTDTEVPPCTPHAGFSHNPPGYNRDLVTPNGFEFVSGGL